MKFVPFRTAPSPCCWSAAHSLHCGWNAWTTTPRLPVIGTLIGLTGSWDRPSRTILSSRRYTTPTRRPERTETSTGPSFRGRTLNAARSYASCLIAVKFAADPTMSGRRSFSSTEHGLKTICWPMPLHRRLWFKGKQARHGFRRRRWIATFRTLASRRSLARSSKRRTARPTVKAASTAHCFRTRCARQWEYRPWKRRWSSCE